MASPNGIEIADLLKLETCGDRVKHVSSRIVPKSDSDAIIALASTTVYLKGLVGVPMLAEIGDAEKAEGISGSEIVHIIAAARGSSDGRAGSRGKVQMYAATRDNSGTLVVSKPIIDVRTPIGCPCTCMDVCIMPATG